MARRAVVCYTLCVLVLPTQAHLGTYETDSEAAMAYDLTGMRRMPCAPHSIAQHSRCLSPPQGLAHRLQSPGICVQHSGQVCLEWCVPANHFDPPCQRVSDHLANLPLHLCHVQPSGSRAVRLAPTLAWRLMNQSWLQWRLW